MNTKPPNTMNPDQSQREAHTHDDDEGFDEIISRVELDTDTITDLCAALRYAFQHLPPRHQEALRAQLKGAGL